MFKRLFNNNSQTCDFTIMVVEDDHAVRQTLVDILQEEGYKVISAYNGEEALKLLDDMEMPDGCVVDLMMPDMDGREFVERARVRFGRSNFSPVMLLTAARHGEVAANVMEVTDFLPKPFEQDVFLQRIHDLVQHRRAAYQQ